MLLGCALLSGHGLKTELIRSMTVGPRPGEQVEAAAWLVWGLVVALVLLGFGCRAALARWELRFGRHVLELRRCRGESVLWRTALPWSRIQAVEVDAGIYDGSIRVQGPGRSVRLSLRTGLADTRSIAEAVFDRLDETLRPLGRRVEREQVTWRPEPD
jgi:membrane protein YdbS with pleckstrin-like domain